MTEPMSASRPPGMSDASWRLVTQVFRFTKGMHRMKIAVAREFPDRAAYALLFPLTEGDKRAADLAEIVHSDPSTVSRHISQLVSSGFVQRVPDQQDGRAALLSVTDKGRAHCHAIQQQRALCFGQAIKDWPDDKAAQLAELLEQLNDDVESGFESVLDGLRRAMQTDTPDPLTESAPEDLK